MRVTMRIRLPRDEGICVPDHIGRDLSVQIERGNDWHTLSDQRAHRREQITFGIGDPFGCHRAMESQQHARHRGRGGQPLQQLRLETQVTVGSDGATGAGAGKQQRRRLCMLCSESFQHTRHHAGTNLKNSVSATQLVSLKRIHSDGQTAEVIAFGQNSSHRDD